MKKIIMIKKNYEFKRLYRKGNVFIAYNLVIYYLKNRYNYCRYGITVSSKIGNAVMRNKIKRRLREALRKNIIKMNLDIILISRHKAISSNVIDFEKVYKNFIHKLEKIHVC